MADAGRVLPLLQGDWTSGNDYELLDQVTYDGSTYTAKVNISNSTIAPNVDTTNWVCSARGYAAELLSLVDATDTEGLLGTVGATVTGQALIDEIADRVLTKLLPIDNLVNNGTSTVEGFALDSRYGKTLADEITTITSDLTNDTGGSGYYSFPNGFKVCWGYTNERTIIFPITFNNVPSIQLTVVADNDNYYYTTKVRTASTTGFTFNTQYAVFGSAVDANGGDNTYWIAVGY